MYTDIKNEGRKRLEKLVEQGLETDIDVLKLYDNNELCVSKCDLIFGEICGVIIPLKHKPEYKKLVENEIITDNYGMPYLALVQNTSRGMILTVLCVSKNPNDWNQEREILERQMAHAFVFYLSDGQVRIETMEYKMHLGGPVRIA